MDCPRVQTRLVLLLSDDLEDAERADLEAHLEDCEACQSIPVLDPNWARLLRQKLPDDQVSPQLRQRIVSQWQAPSTPHEVSNPPAVARNQPWDERVLGSTWTPRLAMVAVLLLLLLVPLRSFFRSPALAQVIAERHECHTEAGSPLPCCQMLDLAVGGSLGAPSLGLVVPDLRLQGLELEQVSRCSFKGEVMNVLTYRNAESRTFSLYITDRVAKQFGGLRTHDEAGRLQTQDRVRDNRIAIWENNGLVYFWVGDAGSASYAVALDGLRAH